MICEDIGLKPGLSRFVFCPRICGEKQRRAMGSSSERGTPPRARGKGSGRSRGLHRPGITPARAGKRAMKQTPSLLVWDHPRTCGEKDTSASTISATTGSPPHVRGKAVPARLFPCKKGITPARAGKSGVVPHAPAQPADHPRACGEKGKIGVLIDRPKGSPPRVRGKEEPLRPCARAAGITPARAGKSLWTGKTSSCTKDHPRACGEKDGLGGWNCRHSGSPPRVRGKVGQTFPIENPPGITPARAGKRTWRPGQRDRRRDHPRACGEKQYPPVATDL